MRRGRAIALAACLLLVLGGGGLVCQRVAERGRFAAGYSSFGSGPSGTRALYLLARERGWGAERLVHDLAGPPAAATLVALGGCENRSSRPLSRFERNTLRDWLEQGGTLLLAGATTYLAEGELGVWLERDPEVCDPERGVLGMIARAQRAAEDGGVPAGGGARKEAARNERDGAAAGGKRTSSLAELEAALQEDPGRTMADLAERDPEPVPLLLQTSDGPLEGLRGASMRRPATIRTDGETTPRVIASFEDGEPAAIVVPRGRGRIVALASASSFRNEDLVSMSGAALFARLVDAYGGDGPLIFDEYHLGLGQRRSITQYLRKMGGTAVVLQLLVVVAMLLWRGGTRFGAIRAGVEEPPAGTASYVGAVGRLYRKAADPDGAVGILVRRALLRIAIHHRLPPSAAERLARALEERGQHREGAVVRELAEMGRSPAQRRQGLVARARHIDRLVATATRDTSTDTKERT